MGLHRRTVDQDLRWRASCRCQNIEDIDPNAFRSPSDEPVVERLMGAIDRGRIPPSQTIPDHMDYPADHTPVVHARNATRPREKGRRQPRKQEVRR